MREDIKSNSIIFIIALLLYNISFFTDFLSYNTILKVIALFLIIIEIMYKRMKIRINKNIIFLLIFAIFVFLNLVVSGDFTYIITFLINILIAIMLMQFPNFSKYELKIVGFFCFFHLFFALLVVFCPQSIVNSLFEKIIINGYNTNFSWRIVSGVNVGITKQPGVLSMYMVVSFIYFLSKLLKNQGKFYNMIGLILSIIVIILTTKRSAIIFSFLAITLLFIMFSNKKVLSKNIFKFIITFSLVVIFLFVLNTKYNFIGGILEKSQNLSASNDISNGRIEIWKDSMVLFEDSPLFGIGLKSYYKLKGLDIHNNYIQFLVEMGILGFLTFIICIGNVVFSSLFYCKKKYKKGLNSMPVTTIIGLFLLLFLILYSFVGNTFIDYLPLSLFTIAITFVFNDYYYEGENI